jgi:putative transposase
METSSGLPIRKQIRLRDFHYGGGCSYYITICAYEKQMLFGSCEGGAVSLNAIGRRVRTAWLETGTLRPDVMLDEFIVMPNHMHAILYIQAPAASQLLFRIVGGFKANVTGAVRAMLSNPNFMVWQKRFHDRIIRSDHEAELKREYIRGNPERWG